MCVFLLVVLCVVVAAASAAIVAGRGGYCLAKEVEIILTHADNKTRVKKM